MLLHLVNGTTTSARLLKVHQQPLICGISATLADGGSFYSRQINIREALLATA